MTEKRRPPSIVWVIEAIYIGFIVAAATAGLFLKFLTGSQWVQIAGLTFAAFKLSDSANYYMKKRKESGGEK